MSTPRAYTNLSQIAQHMRNFELVSLARFDCHSFTIMMAYCKCRRRVTGLIIKSNYAPLSPGASGFRLQRQLPHTPKIYLIKPCQTLISMIKLPWLNGTVDGTIPPIEAKQPTSIPWNHHVCWSNPNEPIVRC